MKLGRPQPCRSCDKPIAVCAVRGGTWLPFELALIPAAADAVDAFLPLRHGDLVVFHPIGEVAPRHIESVRWYAQQHRCAEYFRTKAGAYQGWLAKREHVADVAEVLDPLITHLTRETS